MALFSLGSFSPSCPPKVSSEDPLQFGEVFRGQSGKCYNNVYFQGIALTLEFERLTLEEAALLKKYCKATGNSPYAEFVLVERGRLFDGSSYNAEEGRVLHRMRVSTWSFSPYDGRYDDAEDPAANLTLQKATVTVEEV